MVYLVVLVEALLALAATLLTWKLRRSRLFSTCCVLLGMTWCAFLHGFIFAVVLQDGGNDYGMLAGFGVVIALFFGIPAGLILGQVLPRFIRSEPMQ
ncbi:MAG TPA: hypothetical protein PLN21_06845 [Gemmatales bacterium]|nr:hypothetical protein [Gemmatales bacterium]